jgi:hypothetical protein
MRLACLGPSLLCGPSAVFGYDMNLHLLGCSRQDFQVMEVQAESGADRDRRNMILEHQ